jgi:hypothetical protein
VAIDLDVDAGGQGGPLPTLVLTSEIVAEEVTAQGLAKVRSMILDVAARERAGAMVPAASMTEHTQVMRGISLTGNLTARGTLLGVAVDTTGRQLPPALDAQIGSLRRSFEQVAMPLPAEPVGVGAVWRYKKTFEQNGMTLRTVTDVVVTGIHDDQFSFTSTSVVSGDEQKLTQGGTTVTVTNLGGRGTGAGTIDLARMTMNGELNAELTSDMSADGETARMSMKMMTKIRPTTSTAASAGSAAPTGPGSASGSAQGEQSAP